MCLKFTERSHLFKLKKPITVYKFYDVKGDIVRSPYQSVLVNLVKGRNIKSNRRRTSISCREKRERRVDYGFHIFVLKRDAKKKCFFGDGRRVARFTGFPSNFVAKGHFNSRESMVFTKLRFIGWAK